MAAEYRIERLNAKTTYRDNVENVTLTIPAYVELTDFAYPQETEAPEFRNLIMESLLNPIGAPLLSEIAKGRSNVSILVSDATRAVSTARVLPYVIDELEDAGIALSSIKLIVAIGVHRDATESEKKEIAGPYYGRISVENHDPYSPDRLITLGVTSYGNQIEVNASAYKSDLRISIGKIEAHEFAGFSGGRKSVLPGIASERCIAYNHRPEMILHPCSVPGNLDGNPIHLDMLETAKKLGVDFCVNLVQNASGEPIGIFCGDLEQSHAAGVDFLRARLGVNISRRADIYLVTPGHPLNIDLYQSIKPLIALTPIVKRGDTIVFYSKCQEGVASDDMLIPFEKADNIDDILNYITSDYRIQMDHALLLCKLYQKGVNIVAYSKGVDSSVLRGIRMIPASSAEDALTKACARYGKGSSPKLAIIPMAQRFVLNLV